MRVIFGILLIIIGIGIGLYVGIWLMFVGGIIQLIDAVRADILVASEVAWGIAKILLAGLTGTLSAYIFILPGLFLVRSD
jgi:hypothetical protein